MLAALVLLASAGAGVAAEGAADGTAAVGAAGGVVAGAGGGAATCAAGAATVGAGTAPAPRPVGRPIRTVASPDSAAASGGCGRAPATSPAPAMPVTLTKRVASGCSRSVGVSGRSRSSGRSVGSGPVGGVTSRVGPGSGAPARAGAATAAPTAGAPAGGVQAASPCSRRRSVAMSGGRCSGRTARPASIASRKASG